jgi:glycosyltransferase involved in cell wall biosynthesis
VHGSGAETYGLAAAEAIASGLAIVVPDNGGAGDLAARGLSKTYRAGDVADGARAILAALAGRVDAPTAPPPASLDEHFTALFALYEALRSDKPRALPAKVESFWRQGSASRYRVRAFLVRSACFTPSGKGSSVLVQKFAGS